MLRGALANQLDLVVTAVKAIPQAVGVLSKMAGQKAGDTAGDTVAAMVSRLKGRPASALGRSVSNLGLAPRTRLNSTLSDTRVFAAVSLPLAQFNATRRKHKASLNDAVLMVCSGALRRNFLKHGPLPRKSMVAGVPVSTRAKDDSSSNTQATMTVVSLGTHIADPAKRLRHVLAATASMKSNIGAMKSLMPTDFPSLGVPWLMERLGALYAKARVADRLPAISNVTISNVPGPTVPLYIAGAKLLTNYPTSIVVHGVALNITVQTYNESLEFGIIACGEAMPEVGELAQHVLAAFDEFAALPATVEAMTPAVAVAPAKAAARKAPAKRVAAKKAASKKSATVLPTRAAVTRRQASVPKASPRAKVSTPKRGPTTR
jgi:WS/DGAT/MGAT family acyltransferase